jgi:hypothetical protein
MVFLHSSNTLPLQGGYFYYCTRTQGGAEYRLPWAKIPCPAGAALLTVITLRFILAFVCELLFL